MPKGVYIGQFSEEDIKVGRDKAATQKVKEETGLKYVNHQFVKKNGEIVAIRLWACSVEDCEDFK